MNHLQAFSQSFVNFQDFWQNHQHAYVVCRVLFIYLEWCCGGCIWTGWKTTKCWLLRRVAVGMETLLHSTVSQTAGPAPSLHHAIQHSPSNKQSRINNINIICARIFKIIFIQYRYFTLKYSSMSDWETNHFDDTKEMVNCFWSPNSDLKNVPTLTLSRLSYVVFHNSNDSERRK